jgi:hypothetical protein
MNNIRPVREDFGPGTAMVLGSAFDFANLVNAHMKVHATVYDCKEHGGYKIWVEKGAKLLDFLDKCDPKKIGGSEKCVVLLVQNMKNLAPSWRNSLDDEGGLTFLVD